MDKKKTLTALLFVLGLFVIPAGLLSAQSPSKLEFYDRTYAYGLGNDTIRIYFNIFGADNSRLQNLTDGDFAQFFMLAEDGRAVAAPTFRKLSTGVRIPREYTFSILLDQSIADAGKRQMLRALKEFVEIAPDSTVYVSFYGDKVSNSIKTTAANFGEIERRFLTAADGKAFYSGVYAKLAEFTSGAPEIDSVRAENYVPDKAISARAAAHPEKSILMVFAEGSRRPDDEALDILSVNDLQAQHASSLPKVYAFYYTADGEDTNIETTLDVITQPRDANNALISGLAGTVKSSASMSDVLESFATIVNDAAYDYELTYTAAPDKVYTGNVDYEAKWGNSTIGTGKFTIGSPERAWPEREQSTVSIFAELLVALLVTVLTFGFFFFVMKIAVPYVRFLAFRSKYYRKYQPEENVQRRICHYCKQELRPGQIIVARCNHWMHRHCWEENGYKCAEFGQNCKTGIQEHIDWRNLFTLASIKESSQTIAGVLAGLVSWLVYEICGRGGFKGLSEGIVGLVFKGTDTQGSLVSDCVTRTSSFLMIGLLLGFFISLVFRFKDDIRNKTWRIWLKIIGLSAMTGAVGMLAFAIGADIFCLILSWTGKTYIPWYCSLPAYILFSISVSLALTVKSSIPVKSALIGGTVSVAIGFLVLYFTRFTSARYEWLNMLLDFIIYGGGLGASLVTVRLLAEKYFLVIQNGVKAGQRIPIHKWMNATGGGNKVSIGMTGECEIQMNWEKSNKVAKEHAQMYIDHEKMLPVIKPMATGVLYNSCAELPVNRAAVLSNGDTFRIGDTIFKYEEA